MCHGNLMGWILAVIGLGAVPLWGQSTSDQVQDLQRQIRALQETLNRIESVPQDKPRVTQLGTSRVPMEEKEDILVVRIYDLSDLFVVAPPYPAAYPNATEGESLVFPSPHTEYSGMMGMGGMGGMMPQGARGAGPGSNAGGQPSGKPGVPRHILPQMLSADSAAVNPDAARMSMDDLIEAITRTISPPDWESVGGKCSIAPLGNSLIIAATKNIHQQIDMLFAEFRKRWGSLRTVSIEAHWLWLTEEQVGRLQTNSRRRESEEKIFGLIDEAPWNDLRKELAKAGDERPADYQSVITGFNGQTISTVAGGLQRFVVDMIPVVGQEMKQAAPVPSSPAVGYQPVTTTIQEGAAMQVTPMVSISGKYITLDVHSRVLRVQESKTTPPADSQSPSITSTVIQDLANAVDRPRIANYHLATTLRIPEGRRMLVGGMTFESSSQPNQPNLYFFVKVQVQELRDDAVEARPNVDKGEK